MFDLFSGDSRVWIYKADRELSKSEQEKILFLTRSFLKDWAAHGSQLFAEATIIENWALVIAVNEKITSASGCSIDTKVQFVKSLEKEFSVDFFNRIKVLIKKGDELKQIQFSELSEYPNWNLLNPMLSTITEFREKLWLKVDQTAWT